MFYRETVTIPPRPVNWPEVLFDLQTVDHVFQNLVQGVAHVEMAIRVRRAVVQHKQGKVV